MILEDKKTSLLVPYQLPEFVRDNPEYQNFDLFLKAYYEWMELANASNSAISTANSSGQGVTYASKNLSNYADVDATIDGFINYYTNDFLPYFPSEVMVDKREAIKFARQLYQSKGTPSSYKFLFRILYDSDFDYFNTKDAVLKTSDGKWYVAKSLKLATFNENFLNIANLRLFGETTKSIATVETSVLAGTKTEVFISNIERLFQSGEFVRVVDNNNQTVLFSGQPLRAKIVGQLSQLKIDPNNRGLLYQPGDPVVVYGGLNSNTGLGATGIVSSTTTGSIQRINVTNGGYGYRYDPNTVITITNAPGAIANVATLNSTGGANVAVIPIDSIALKRFITIGNTNFSFSNIAIANANTTLSNAFSFITLETYPISSVQVNNGGGGISQTPVVSASSIYQADNTNKVFLGSLGILAPIQIVNGGTGYQANDTIVFSGGTGSGAFANVTSVNGSGAITGVSYVYSPTYTYPLGGMGYRATTLPTLSVSSANPSAANASLYVPGILGDGATFSVVVTRAGSITTISLTEPGEDYIAAPNVSIKIQDIAVSNVSLLSLPQKGELVYQGANTNVASYIATVDSITRLTTDNDPLLSKYKLRVYNYTSAPYGGLQLKINRTDGNVNMNMVNTALPQFVYTYSGVLDNNGNPYTRTYDSTGVITYGDGNAKGTASFLNGLVISQGQYLNTQGQPSSYDVLQSSNFNNFTYQITTDKEISKYKEVLLNLLHPSGTKLLGRYTLKSNNNFTVTSVTGLRQGHSLAYYTGYPASFATMTTDFTNKSTNVVEFYNLLGANLQDFITTTSTVTMVDNDGNEITSDVIGITGVSVQDINSESGSEDLMALNGTEDLMLVNADSITLDDFVWLTYPNVAVITANSGSNVINITSITNSYNIINNGVYSNTAYPLKDIVHVGDTVLIANNSSQTVSNIDYINGKIYVPTNFAAYSNSYLTVNRTFIATDVKIYGPTGIQYIPELTTESGDTLLTENGNTILLG
jgi:hypothetical protein